jgi:hypothetical protein
MVIEVMPSEDEDVSEVMPAMVESWRSIGAAFPMPPWFPRWRRAASR